MKKERTHMSIFIQVLIFAVIGNLANGSNYVWSIYGAHMIEEAGWSATLASLPYTFNIAASAFTPLIGGYINDKYSPKVTVAICAVLYFLGWYLCGSSTNPAVIIMCYGILCGAAQGMNPNASSSTCGKWAPAGMKGLATGIPHAANGLSSMYMAPLGTVLMAIGLSTAFHTMGFIAGGLCLIASIGLVTPRFDEGAVNVTAADANEENNTFKGLIKTKAFWLLFLINSVGLIGGGVVFSQCANIAKVQAGWTGGYILVCILALANGLGRIIWNGVSDKIGVYKTYMAMFVASGLGILVLMFASNIPMLIIGVCLVGSAFGGTNSMLYAAASYEFGTRGLGKAHAALVPGYLFNGVFGATIAGYALDTYGSYTLAYGVGLAFLVIGIGIAVMLQKNHVDPVEA